MPRSFAPLLVAVSAGLIGACGYHAVVDDGSSVSYGWSRTGMLLNPARVPTEGTGFYAPNRWESRGLRYGTDELVSAIVWVGRELERASPGSALAVADLSLGKGGPSAWHRSHQHGRDVDIPFLLRTRKGEFLRPQEMRRFGIEGTMLGPNRAPLDPSPDAVFDVERNWALVRLLIQNPIAEIQYIFVSDDLKQLLIEYAATSDESAEIIAAASYLLHQPSDSAPHDDHFHVRVYCSVDDLAFGCHDTGTLRWLKKSYKYERPVERAGLGRLLALFRTLPVSLMSSIVGL